MTDGSLLRERRLELGLTQLEVAQRIGVSEATISRWESGDIANMRRDRIAALAEVLQISPLQIMGMSLDDVSSYGILPIEIKKIPLLGEIACGEPIYASEDRESYVIAGTDIKADFALRAKGDSMIGARIMDGDIVFIRKQTMVDNGEIAAVIIEDESTLKRVYYYPEDKRLILQAENAKYPPFVYQNSALDRVRILGKALAFQSDVV